jgi:uncharacterized oxidoreductase
MSGEVRVDKGRLGGFGRSLLEACGTPAAHAAQVVDHLLEADAMGLRSHGIIRLPQYLDDVGRGETRPAAVPRFASRAAGRADCDGGWAFGQVVGAAMARRAVDLASIAVISFVTGRHMGHTGRIGAYAEMMAAAGMVGIAVCSGPRAGHFVAPFGGREGRLATNPMAYAVPVADGPPIVADFSTSVVPEGVARSLLHRGLPVPEGALRDAEGQPTTDPAALYADPRGALQPLGGPVGYRGTAMAILVDVLAALLAGDETDDGARAGSNLAMVAIAADEALAGRSFRLARYVRSSPPIVATQPVMLPGEREQATAASATTIPVDAPTWATLRERATAAGLEVPQAALP